LRRIPDLIVLTYAGETSTPAAVSFAARSLGPSFGDFSGRLRHVG